ncbi:MAG: hypothetical protein WDO73_14220 [Ignavibacteriota bacterium]
MSSTGRGPHGSAAPTPFTPLTFFEPLHHRVMASLYPLVPWVGVLVALALSGLIRNQLYGLHANDPIAIVASVLLLAGLAGFIPSLPANHVDPTTALRSE